MKDRTKRRIQIFMPGIVMSSFILFWTIVAILLMVFFGQKYDAWFWVLISFFIFICLLMIWGIIASYQYVDIDYSEIKIVYYKETCSIELTDIELVEVRKSAIGHTSIIIAAKGPIQLFKRKTAHKIKVMQEFTFIDNDKLVRALKHYLPEDIPWIFNDYYKNPNSEPKRNKRK